MKPWIIPLTLLALIGRASADGIDLVTLPERSSVQLTIYNSADLTLVREVRNLTLKKGLNRLSFDWASTLIDPTSLSLRAVKSPQAVDLQDVSFPPRLNTKAVWAVRSDVEGEVPVEITFFTSGISWRAFYMATLAPDEKTMRLAGFVRVQNASGEDYDGAQTRVVVGRIHLLDEIAALARRPAPFGRPGEGGEGQRPPAPAAARAQKVEAAKDALAEQAAPKQIIKEGLSEYFLYTIEGTETIPTGWAKRLPSFEVDGIPVDNLYKYEEERYGTAVIRFISTRNDAAHKLGQTPLPDGLVKVYRSVDAASHLSYEGACDTRYIPVEQKAELNLGPARSVTVEPKLMDIRTENYTFDQNGNPNGFDQLETYRVTVKNQREVPIRVEVTRNFRHQYSEVDRPEGGVEFNREDLDTVKFTLELAPRTEKAFDYKVRYYEGERQTRR
jgi:hypothetical protein